MEYPYSTAMTTPPQSNQEVEPSVNGKHYEQNKLENYPNTNAMYRLSQPAN